MFFLFDYSLLLVFFLFCVLFYFFFFFNDTATTEIYTLSLHDALPIGPAPKRCCVCPADCHPESRRRRGTSQSESRLRKVRCAINSASERSVTPFGMTEKRWLRPDAARPEIGTALSQKRITSRLIEKT